MKKCLMLLLAASIGLAACNNFEKGPSGTLYKIHKSGGKEKIKEGDYVRFDLTQYTDTDTLMYSTYDIEQPVVFQVAKKNYAGDMNDVLTFFGEGDSVTFKIDIDTMAKFSGQPKPPQLKGKYLVFNAKILNVLRKNAGEPDSVFNKRASDFFQKEYTAGVERVKKSEDAKIKAYISDNNLKTQVTASGLHYVITNPGSGPKAVMGDTCMVNYTGKFTKKKSDGKDYVFDTSDIKVAKESNTFQPLAPYGPRPVVVGQVIPGFTEGLLMMAKGAKATFIIPSKLGYGENGARPMIGPYAPLVFELEVRDIKKPVAAGVLPPVAPAGKK